MKKNYIIFNILTVVAYFYGVLLCATLVLLPLGVYAVISAHRYSEFADFTAGQVVQNKKRMQNWIIFGCVLYFPIGLIGLMCLNVKPEDVTVEEPKQEAEQPTEPQTEQPTVEVEIHNPTTTAEKEEKLEKLLRFKEKGLITEEEFEQAKQQLTEDK